MAEQFITCPHCHKKIRLTEAFTHQIEEKLQKNFDSQLKEKEKDFEDRYEKDRAKLEKQARKQAEDEVSTEINDLKEALKEKTKQAEEFQKQELALRKRQRELEDREANLKLEVERTLEKERGKIGEDAAAKVAEEHRLKDHEKDLQMEGLRKQIEELKRKADQGSQQAQGEVLELELEDVLRSKFPHDTILPVPKGTKGADVLQRVHSANGQVCGTILWESKRTKTWSDGWLGKLRDDQRDAKADMAVLVSVTLPKGLNHLDYLDRVWVTDFPAAIGLATALRASLIELAQARSALVGKSEKMELIYGYLSGPEFRQKVEAIVESFVAMKTDLDSEKRAMEKIWGNREKQIQRVIGNMAHMYGDLQGIIGASLPEIKVLELPSGERAEP
jgi:hypothetical protein